AWMKQKKRHYTTAKYYKPKHKFLLGLYTFTQFLFYPALIACAVFYDWRIALGVLGLKWMVQGFIYFKAMKKLNENDLWPLFIFLDIWMFFYYIIFAPSLWKKAKNAW
ncbi:MAG: glycosyl transferase family 2, partial [Bacteroidetes bacterium]|nr:glycosyl transferase family 2 [Bacteroidota bacterium]